MNIDNPSNKQHKAPSGDISITTVNEELSRICDEDAKLLGNNMFYANKLEVLIVLVDKTCR